MWKSHGQAGEGTGPTRGRGARGPGNRLSPTPRTRGSRLGSFLRNDRLHRLEGPQRRRDFLTRGDGPSGNVPLPGTQALRQAGASPLLASFLPRLPSSCVTRPASPAPVPRAILRLPPPAVPRQHPGRGPAPARGEELGRRLAHYGIIFPPKLIFTERVMVSRGQRGSESFVFGHLAGFLKYKRQSTNAAQMERPRALKTRWKRMCFT